MRLFAIFLVSMLITQGSETALPPQLSRRCRDLNGQNEFRSSIPILFDNIWTFGPMPNHLMVYLNCTDGAIEARHIGYYENDLGSEPIFVKTVLRGKKYVTVQYQAPDKFVVTVTDIDSSFRRSPVTYKLSLDLNYYISLSVLNGLPLVREPLGMLNVERIERRITFSGASLNTAIEDEIFSADQVDIVEVLGNHSGDLSPIDPQVIFDAELFAIRSVDKKIRWDTREYAQIFQELVSINDQVRSHRNIDFASGNSIFRELCVELIK